MPRLLRFVEAIVAEEQRIYWRDRGEGTGNGTPSSRAPPCRRRPATARRAPMRSGFVAAPDSGCDPPAPLLFLRHAGANADATQRPKRRLEDAPDARAAGLRIWFDQAARRGDVPQRT